MSGSDDELRLYRTVLETSGELIWSLDREGRWTSLNSLAAQRIYGCEAAELLGRPFTEVVARELRERDYAVFRRVLEGQPAFDHVTRHVRSDGVPIDLSFSAVALRDGAGAVVGAAGTARDISEHKRAAAALHETVQKLRLAVDAADLHYWEWDAASGRLGWGGEAAPVPEDPEGSLRRAIAKREPFEIEYRVAGTDGRPRWLAARGLPMASAAGEVRRMIGVCRDITEAKAREEAVRHLAYHDTLTGLPNRRLLDDRLAQAIHLAQRRDRKLAVMVIDLDEFKQVNDSLGHRAGDAVLREVAQRLSSCVRRADTLARHGGDEFVVVVSDVQTDADCALVAEKVLRSLEAPVHLDGRALALGASIGISLFPADAGDGDALLRNADAAMYSAKQQGRNQYRFYGR
ncbi:MAG TPA: diguanylate cyclase [Burkholderiales bacterium]|nr:diguanylate cyclase [Burkholderiales bacterium]